MCYLKICNDLFQISKRIKEIDKDYFVLYNTQKNRYEIHCENQPFGTLCVVVPFKTLDVRTIYYLHKTRNKDVILSEIEKNNNYLEEKEKEIKKDETNYKLKDIFKFANNGKEFIANNAYKNLWI